MGMGEETMVEMERGGGSAGREEKVAGVVMGKWEMAVAVRAWVGLDWGARDLVNVERAVEVHEERPTLSHAT